MQQQALGSSWTHQQLLPQNKSHMNESCHIVHAHARIQPQLHHACTKQVMTHS